MIAYEFYRRDEKKGEILIGILPEKRKDPKRITQESIMNWIRKTLGDQEDIQNIYYHEVKLE